MTILFKYASRERPERFFKGLDSIVGNVTSDDYHILCSFDSDDPSMNNDAVRDRLSLYGNLTYYFDTSTSKVEAINRDLYKAPKFDILVNFSDDMEFTVKGFDEIIRREMPPDLDWVLHFPDNTTNGKRLMTMDIKGKAYFQRTYRIYHNEYRSVYCDDEETQKAKLLGCYKFVDQNIFKHDHWLFGGEKDDLNRRNDSSDMYAHDRDVFRRRKKNNFK